MDAARLQTLERHLSTRSADQFGKLLSTALKLANVEKPSNVVPFRPKKTQSPKAKPL